MGFLYVHFPTLLHLRPLDFTVSEDAGIEPTTVVTLALAVRRSNHLAISHSQINIYKKILCGGKDICELSPLRLFIPPPQPWPPPCIPEKPPRDVKNMKVRKIFIIF